MKSFLGLERRDSEAYKNHVGGREERVTDFFLSFSAAETS
jgi:hypothetical protein